MSTANHVWDGKETVAAGMLDGKGKPFIPGKHLPKTHPTGKHWQPKGGYTKAMREARKAAPAASPAPSPAPAPAPEMGRPIHAIKWPASHPAPVAAPAADPVTIATAADPTATAAAEMAADMPPISGGPAESPPPAPAPAPVASQSILSSDAHLPPPEIDPAAIPAASGPETAAAAVGDPDADAEICIETLFALVGFSTGHFDEARPLGSRIAAMKKVLSAWLQKKGWVSAGGWAVLLTVFAYFVELVQKPKTGAKVRGWMGLAARDEAARVASAKNVSPAAAPAASPAPVAPVLKNEKGETIFGGIRT